MFNGFPEVFSSATTPRNLHSRFEAVCPAKIFNELLEVNYKNANSLTMSSIIQNKFHELGGDYARVTKFNFIIPPITGLPALTDLITYSVKALTLPKIEHQPNVIKHKGRDIPIRGITKFNQQFTVTFYMHENHILKRFFEAWIAMIEQRHYYYNPRQAEQEQRMLSGLGNTRPDYMTFYNIKTFIEQRNFDGDMPTAVYEIYNTFPISVDGPAYDYSQVGVIGEFTVTFAYSHYMLFSKGFERPSFGALQNQLHHSTGRAGRPDYAFDAERFKTFNDFHDLDQKPHLEGLPQEVYWRPYELARWDNMWNRWREDNGANTAPAQAPKSFDPDTIDNP